ncbi:Sec-independent protein translocase protein TatB [Methylobacterium sp. WL8]|uniref:Sec-independent protein translocase protein TatB n=1 Tax=Methylobacterium sp. WL8 TaxID=2603899 RepID=UPI0011CBB3C1|nr:Sec-independent protein translocase protein TatB [Methylobacterium sp. WL8]TXN82886.1 twin-arginine translocase subunit TatB [Methylobacterium sp. WL8]
MLDMSWGEVMLIGGVALIVIGPKDLPKALRTVGQVTRKVRRMAGEFQMQFNEAIREAELDDVRKEVDGIRDTVRNASGGFNPVQTIRDELKGAVEARAPKPSAATLADATAQLKAAESETPASGGGAYDVPKALDQPVAQTTAQHATDIEAAPAAPPVPGSVDDPYGPAPDPAPAPHGPAPSAPAAGH